MVASSCSSEPESGSFETQEVGSSGFLARHNRQIFAEGRSFSGNERDKVFLNEGDATFVSRPFAAKQPLTQDHDLAIRCT